ncbi:Protein of unknown function [Cotesia congregata]|uniref:BED-type domain-containing protein n=1 Tax=Cotesia congregata TaxID=51543 RepID=A0A8J2HPX6_COTCN|nr:Protein of unknown function [Cotesia congregata]
MNVDILSKSESNSQSEVETEGTDNETELDQNQKEFHNKIENSPLLSETFFTIDVTQSTDKNLIAECNFCHPKKIIRGSTRTTSNYTSHLEVKIKSRWSCVFDQETFEKNVTTYVLKSLLPFSSVEDPHFRKIFDVSSLHKPFLNSNMPLRKCQK